MRYFELLGLQHVILFLFPSLVFIVLFYIALSRARFERRDSQAREARVTHAFADGIEERDAPFPLFLLLVILGYVLWTIFYALGTGLLGVKI